MVTHPTFARAAVGGLTGTLAMTAMMYFIAPDGLTEGALEMAWTDTSAFGKSIQGERLRKVLFDVFQDTRETPRWQAAGGRRRRRRQ